MCFTGIPAPSLPVEAAAEAQELDLNEMPEQSCFHVQLQPLCVAEWVEGGSTGLLCMPLKGVLSNNTFIRSLLEVPSAACLLRRSSLI